MFSTITCIVIVLCLTIGYVGLFIDDDIAPIFFKVSFALYVLGMIMSYFCILARN